METFFIMMVAFFNGFLIVTIRAVNAKLGMYVSGAGAALWNHLVGCLFLALLVPFLTGEVPMNIGRIPFYLLVGGGIIGASYVAINNWVMPRVGVTKATVFVIAGQIVLGTVIELANGKVSHLGMTMIGVSLVVLGMWIGNMQNVNASTTHKLQK